MSDEPKTPKAATKVVDAPAPSPAVRSPLETLRALQKIASASAAQATKEAHEAENKARGVAGEKGAALAESAHHLRATANAFGRAEGGINTALQALEHAGIHGDRSAHALKKVTS